MQLLHSYFTFSSFLILQGTAITLVPLGESSLATVVSLSAFLDAITTRQPGEGKESVSASKGYQKSSHS